MKELIEKLNESGMLWFFLGSNISADRLLSENDCKGALTIVDEIKECLDDTNLDDETKGKVRKYLVESEEIIMKDMVKFKSN